MRRRHHYRRRGAEQAEPDMTTFLNLIVVLVPFLRMTAVVSQLAGLEAAAAAMALSQHGAAR